MSLARHPPPSPADLESPFATVPELDGRNPGELAFLLASRRTRLSFQRTRMSADRTLMAIVRTALSLIGFGFTIYQFFRYLRQSAGVAEAVVRPEAARNFSIALVTVGVLMLVLGITSHVRFMLELRADHARLVLARLIPTDQFPHSVTLAVALLLLLIGVLAMLSMVVRAGPFH
jgi:inner membrane protein YidH